jgi:hypothetical protein
MAQNVVESPTKFGLPLITTATSVVVVVVAVVLVVSTADSRRNGPFLLFQRLTAAGTDHDDENETETKISHSNQQRVRNRVMALIQAMEPLEVSSGTVLVEQGGARDMTF